ncbi:MAG TPA: hypothetical protein VLT33_20005 [Labilithrix sp.]|nr:hypothetical protein [Labilithrix sp.]
MRRVLAIAVMVGAVAGCATYRDALARGQDSFEKNEYERSLGVLRALEPDVGRLSPAEQAQYAYLRGMTDYRMGYRADARHWLALARAHDDASPGTLPAAWKTRMTDALAELDDVVHTEGLAALATPRKPAESPPR